MQSNALILLDHSDVQAFETSDDGSSDWTILTGVFLVQGCLEQTGDFNLVGDKDGGTWGAGPLRPVSKADAAPSGSH